MTIPTTGVTFSSIQTEFGGANPVGLSEYHRGGTYVPSGQATSVTDGTAVSTSGLIRVGMFRGLTKTASGSTLVAGFGSGQGAGYQQTGSFGTLSPNPSPGPISGSLITGLWDQIGAGGGLRLTVLKAGLSKTSFTTLTINGTAFTSASSSFSTTASVAIWQGSSMAGMTSGLTYFLQFA